jgi:type II secretory pathway pseudopilin PulG
MKKEFSIFGFKFRVSKGFTLIELVLYMGILVLLITVLSTILTAIVDVQLNSNSTSSVDQDGNYLLAKLTHDVASSSAVLVPANPGNQTSTLQLTINSINYTYSLNSSNNLQVVNSSTNETNVLNSYNTSVSGLTFTRIGSGGSGDTVQVTYSITSRIKIRGGFETKSFTTTLGED